MNPHNRHPNWWMLYLLLPLVVGAFVFEVRAPLSEVGHRSVEILILLVAYGLIELWFTVNGPALILGERERYRNELLRSSATRRRPLLVRQVTFRKNGKVHPGWIARWAPTWLLAFFSAVANFFNQ